MRVIIAAQEISFPLEKQIQFYVGFRQSSRYDAAVGVAAATLSQNLRRASAVRTVPLSEAPATAMAGRTS